jgi:HEAT repeat protein
MGEPKSIRELIAVFCSQPEEGGLSRMQKARIDLERWYASYDHEYVVRRLLELWDDEDIEIQCQAINELLIYDTQAYTDGVLNRALDKLTSSSFEIRGLVVYRLLTHVIHDERVIDPIIRLLNIEPDPDIRYHAISVLRQTGSPRAIPILQWIRDHDKDVNYEGVRISDHASEALQKIIHESQ